MSTTFYSALIVIDSGTWLSTAEGDLCASIVRRNSMEIVAENTDAQIAVDVPNPSARTARISIIWISKGQWQ